MPLTTEEVRDLAALVRARSTGAPLPARRPEHAPYVEVLLGLHKGVDVLGTLRGVEFRPYLLLNGLLHASTLEEEGLRFTCSVLARGLEEFAGYFVAKAEPGADAAALAAEQHRYFAWLVVQWPECDVEWEGVLMTMKADAADQGSAYQARAILEEGPPALMACDLFNAEEKQAFARVFEREPGAWDELRDLMVRLWKIPVTVAPARQRPPDQRN